MDEIIEFILWDSYSTTTTLEVFFFFLFPLRIQGSTTSMPLHT